MDRPWNAYDFFWIYFWTNSSLGENNVCILKLQIFFFSWLLLKRNHQTHPFHTSCRLGSFTASVVALWLVWQNLLLLNVWFRQRGESGKRKFGHWAVSEVYNWCIASLLLLLLEMWKGVSTFVMPASVILQQCASPLNAKSGIKNRYQIPISLSDSVSWLLYQCPSLSPSLTRHFQQWTARTGSQLLWLCLATNY